MSELNKIFMQQFSLYPGMEIRDCIKLINQNVMGIGHLIKENDDFLKKLYAEINLSKTRNNVKIEFIEPIGNNQCKVNLSSLPKGLSCETFSKLCEISAKKLVFDKSALIEKLLEFKQWAVQGKLHYSKQEVEEQIDEYIASNMPIVGHSERYKLLYEPHYRVLQTDIANVLQAFAIIDRFRKSKPHILVGIEGMSAAGKSEFSKLLEEVYACGVVHADDFFLQQGQRSEARLMTIGGNIDYERLAPIVAAAADGRDFSYEKYDCSIGEMGGMVHVKASEIHVIEGAYSMHPKLAAKYDVKLFFAINASLQIKRIEKRNGKDFARRFINEWIPMENSYFSEYTIREKCDLTFFTDKTIF